MHPVIGMGFCGKHGIDYPVTLRGCPMCWKETLGAAIVWILNQEEYPKKENFNSQFRGGDMILDDLERDGRIIIDTDSILITEVTNERLQDLINRSMRIRDNS